MIPLTASSNMSLSASRMPNFQCHQHQRRYRRRLVSCDHQRRFFCLSAVLMIVIMSRSEAFASLSTSSASQQQQRASGSGIFGQRLIVVPSPSFLSRRGGSQNSNQRKEVTCVMQQMPPLKANSNYDNYDSNNNGNGAVYVKKNGVRRDATPKNGSSNGHEKATDSSASKKQKLTVEFVAETKLPTELGQFQLRAYRVPGAPLGQEPCVIYYRDKPPFGGGSDAEDAIPVRIHDQCLTSEVFGSRRYVLNYFRFANEWGVIGVESYARLAWLLLFCGVLNDAYLFGYR